MNDPENYYVSRSGRAFWKPTPLMRRSGFTDQNLGADGPEAREIAERWNDRWRSVASQPAMLLDLRPERF